jgi:hypothetical protein
VAIRVIPFYAIVLRPFRRNLPTYAWRSLLQRAAEGGFDGEIMIFGAMSAGDIDSKARYLERIGFKGPAHGDHADFVIFEGGSGPLPEWLECVEYRYLNGSERSGRIWKLKNSEVYDLIDTHHRAKLPRKGFEVDWPPFIGKCWD